MSGTKHYPAKELLTELNQKLSPYVTLLKANFSIVILIGLIQISGAIIGFKVYIFCKILKHNERLKNVNYRWGNYTK